MVIRVWLLLWQNEQEIIGYCANFTYYHCWAFGFAEFIKTRFWWKGFSVYLKWTNLLLCYVGAIYSVIHSLHTTSNFQKHLKAGYNGTWKIFKNSVNLFWTQQQKHDSKNPLAFEKSQI